MFKLKTKIAKEREKEREKGSHFRTMKRKIQIKQEREEKGTLQLNS